MDKILTHYSPSDVVITFLCGAEAKRPDCWTGCTLVVTCPQCKDMLRDAAKHGFQPYERGVKYG